MARDSTRKALWQYLEKEHKKGQRKKKKKNGTPEADFVKDKLLPKLRDEMRFDVQVIEAKAHWNSSAGCYTKNTSVDEGTPDIIGTDPDGIAVYIEAKAPKKLNTIRVTQYEYLLQKIKVNAFCACVDDADKCQEIYETWQMIQTREGKKQFLRDQLPTPKGYEDNDFDL